MRITTFALFQPLILGLGNALRIEDIEIPSALQIIKGGFPKHGLNSAGIADKSVGEASVAESFLLYLQAKAWGEAGDPFGLIHATGQDRFVQTTAVSETSRPHVDFERGADEPYAGLVALFALEDHDGAHFEADETCVPIKRNRLFLFNGGRSAHHTVVRNKKLEGDSVKFLGPIAAKTLASVGTPTTTPPATTTTTTTPPATTTTTTTTTPVAGKSGKGSKGTKRARRSDEVEEVGTVEDRYLRGEAKDKILDQQDFHIEDEDVDIGEDRDLEEEAVGELVIEDPENGESM